MTGDLDGDAEPVTAWEDPAGPSSFGEGPSTSGDGQGTPGDDGQSPEVAASAIPSGADIPSGQGPDRAPPEVDRGPALLEAVAAFGDRLSERLDAIQALLERDARAEATRERVVDRLHAELQDYKQDLLLKVQRPIFIDLIQLHDDVGKMVEARIGGDSDPEGSAALRKLLESIQVAVEDILYRQGVEPFSAEGDTFDPRRQRAVSTATTDDPALGKTIAARLRKGFQAGEKVIRPELVSVYTFRPSPPTDPPA